VTHPRNKIYAFVEVEAALAAVHGIDQDQMLAFRGRVHHLQKLGLIPSAPGRGKKPRYSAEDIAIWAFCVELIEVGMSPAVISRVVKKYWNGILFCFVEGSTWDDDCIFIFQPRMLEAEFPDNVELSDTTSIRILSSSKFSEGILNEMGGRIVAINISNLHRRLMDAIADEPMPVAVETRGLSKAKRAKKDPS
jgi:hypothetical protein